MTILLLTQVFPPQPGGSGRWMWELYRRMHGMQVQVVAAEHPASQSFDAASPMPIERLPLALPSWGLAGRRAAAAYVKSFTAVSRVYGRVQPDVVHAAKALPEGLLALALRYRYGVPYWCYAHGEELTLAKASRELRWLTARVLAGASRVIANSTFTRGLLLDEWRMPEDRVVLMHPGVDTNRFTPAPRDEAVRSQLGWTGRRVILTVGALQRRKGQDIVIRALPLIREACPDVLYAIAGEGWERPYLEDLVREMGVSDLVQFRPAPDDDELLTCYQQCDLFALPNRQVGTDVEGFGIALLEAQACGKPVIAGRSGGTTDTFEDHVTGVGVEATSPENVASAVTQLLADNNRLRSMSLSARSLAAERFDWRACERRMMHLIGTGSDIAASSEGTAR